MNMHLAAFETKEELECMDKMLGSKHKRRKIIMIFLYWSLNTQCLSTEAMPPGGQD